MKITKIGHCCLVVEINTVKIITDPGAWSTEQNKITGVDAILITHEHADHLHAESLKQVLDNNPEARVITNESVGKILNGLNIKYELINGELEIKGISLESFNAKHEEIYGEFGQVENTAFIINKNFLYPGDSFFNPHKNIDILALPVAGPWCRIKNSIDYALTLKPKVIFPVHDGMIEIEKIGPFHRVPALTFKNNNINFIPMIAGDSQEF